MSQFVFYLAAFALILGVLVVVHELGHYLVARYVGVKVLRFSFGFGRPVWSWRIGRDGHASASAWPTRFLADDWCAQGETLSKLQRVLDGIDDSRCVLPSHCADSYARLPPTMRGTP